MSVNVIWIDRSEAKIFQLAREKMERKHLKAGHTGHAVRPVERKFFKEVSEHLDEACPLLILGPGIAKHHFLNYLTEECPSLARKVVGCETVDHPTDGQIATMALKFFKLPPIAANSA